MKISKYSHFYFLIGPRYQQLDKQLDRTHFLGHCGAKAERSKSYHFIVRILDNPSVSALRNFKLIRFLKNKVYFVQLQHAHYLNGKKKINYLLSLPLRQPLIKHEILGPKCMHMIYIS